jgi:hypothetical protein
MSPQILAVQHEEIERIEHFADTLAVDDEITGREQVGGKEDWCG